MADQRETCGQCGAAVPADAPGGMCPACLLRYALTATRAAAAAAAGSRRPALPIDPPPVEALAPLFPQLEVVALVGAGGMGIVYRARQVHLDRPVALKLLPVAADDDPAFAERFAREARALARLNHPNIVTVYDFGRAGDYFYLLMEFVAGVNLRQAMRAGRLTPGQALAVVPQVCDALQYAHDQDVIHRDIKPENILLDPEGRVKIVDFGLAKLLLRGGAVTDYTLTQSQVAIGTPHYMAPEQHERPGEVDHRADIYSLGVVFYEMLTGELPLGRFAAPSHKSSAVDARLDDVVFKTLEKEPGRRYQQASELRTSVQAVAPGEPGATNAPRGGGGDPGGAVEPQRVISYVKRVPRRYSRAALAGAVWGVVGILLLPPLLAQLWPRFAGAGGGAGPAGATWSVVTIPPGGGVLRPSAQPPGGVVLVVPGSPGATINGRASSTPPSPSTLPSAAGGSGGASSRGGSGGGGGGVPRQVTPRVISPGRTAPVPLYPATRPSGFTFRGVPRAGGTGGSGGGMTPLAPGGPPAAGPAASDLAGAWLPLIVVAGLSPLGTTVLGLIAIAHVRRSGGMLRGLGLATADTLLFPLLLLNAAVLAAAYFGAQALGEAAGIEVMRGTPALAAGLALGLLVAAVLNAVIVRRVWNAVK
jgi:predicted Ser/Thr protein kinase